jgi:hypothetical protein
MIQALGKVVTLKANRLLTAHDFYLPLTDVLLDLVEINPYAEAALSFSQLACSLAHDFVNLATLAGQLLWYVAVAPVRTGTPDSLAISLAAESYFIFLRTAYDVIATIVLKVCVDPKKLGQLPDDDSFRSLVTWAGKNPGRLPCNLAFLPEHQDWFMQLRGIRDKLVHLGYDLNVYTDDVAPSFGLMSTGEVDLHFLRTPRMTMGERRIKLQPLLPFLRESTERVLHLASQVSDAIVKQAAHTPSHTHVLNGVYIPALNHILSYQEPAKCEMAPEEKTRRKIKAWLLHEAGDYLESLNFGYPDGYWLRFVTHASEFFDSKPPLHLTRPKHPPYRDSELLTEWWLIFEKENVHYGVLLMDARAVDGEWTELGKKLESFKQRYDVSAAALVLNCKIVAGPPFKNLIADCDPFKAAQRVFNLLTEPTEESNDSNAG